jgi:hypothetical protein
MATKRMRHRTLPTAYHCAFTDRICDLTKSRRSLEPTYVHRKGERRGPKSPPRNDDAWHFSPKLSESEPLEQHIQLLWQVVKPKVEYLKSLKTEYNVDIFCGYRSNIDCAGFEVSHKCLELFTALEVPFGVSVIIA